MKRLIKAILSFVLLMSVAGPIKSQDNNWTHFRGSNLDGISSARELPANWDESHVRWKTEIHGKGHSSPVVYENQIWITTATPDGSELYALCVDYQTGEVLFDIKLFSYDESVPKHSINTYASPTPCIEKGFVFVHFGSLGTACLRTSDGSVVWKRTDLKCNHVQGPGSSPVIYKNLLILHYEGTDVRFIVGLDKMTGKEVWRTYRPAEPYIPLAQIGRKAYITPIIIKVKGKDLLISNGSAVCCAYEPLTGKEVWRVVKGAESTVPMPVTENGIVYFYAGSVNDPGGGTFTELVAVNPDGTGDITETNIIWIKRDDQSQTQISTPVIRNGLIYTVTTRNILMCIDAVTGKEIWSQRLRANCNASPLFADGKIWIFTIKGEVLAINPGKSYEEAARSQVDSGIWATPAFLRNSVILRTEKFLYRISL